MAKPLTSLVVMSEVAPETVPESKALMSVTALGAAPDDPLEYEVRRQPKKRAAARASPGDGPRPAGAAWVTNTSSRVSSSVSGSREPVGPAA